MSTNTCPKCGREVETRDGVILAHNIHIRRRKAARCKGSPVIPQGEAFVKPVSPVRALNPLML